MSSRKKISKIAGTLWATPTKNVLVFADKIFAKSLQFAKFVKISYHEYFPLHVRFAELNLSELNCFNSWVGIKINIFILDRDTISPERHITGIRECF